jgi:hypothetical protein
MTGADLDPWEWVLIGWQGILNMLGKCLTSLGKDVYGLLAVAELQFGRAVTPNKQVVTQAR